jgi:tetratricopeptide (TPR) repeat protein
MPEKRLRKLEKHSHLVQQRDDLSVELCALYNQTGQPEKALSIIASRKFQPWEGGEGQALGQHVRTHLALGRAALKDGFAFEACRRFEMALTSPPNLSEAKHPLANDSDIRYWLGAALDNSGDKTGARRQWKLAAEFRGDFQGMSVRTFSEMTYYSALSLERLGEKDAARKLLEELLAYAKRLARAPAQIDYFATSLPTMLLFETDVQAQQRTTAAFLRAQANLGLGRRKQATRLLTRILSTDPNHALAADLLAEIQ